MWQLHKEVILHNVLVNTLLFELLRTLATISFIQKKKHVHNFPK
jgi:hypothetical protein